MGRGVRVRQHGKGILGEIAAANVLQHFGPKGFEFVPARQVLQLGHQDVGDRQVARSQFPCPLERLDRFVQPAQFLEGQRAVRPEVGDARVQLQRLVVALERQIGAAEHAQDIAHADPHVDVAVVDGKRFFEAGQRVRHAVHEHQRLRQRGPQLGMPRRQVQPAFVAGDGLLRAFQPQQRVAAVQPGVGQAWFELQGAVEALHRLIVAAEGVQRVAAVVPDARLVRVECQGAVEEGDGFIGTVLLRAGDPQQAQRAGVAFVQGQGLAQRRLRLAGLAGHDLRDAEQLPGTGMAGLRLHDLPAQCGGLCRLAAFEQLDGLRHLRRRLGTVAEHRAVAGRSWLAHAKGRYRAGWRATPQ